MRIIVNVICFLVGALFIFSGFVKAVDPLGFSYKLNDYFEVFNMAWLMPISLILSIIICAFEILLGFVLIVRYNIRQFSWLILAMILFFTWLTGFSAYTGKVTDCGCFGDAIPLTPIQSFYKDLILLVLIVVIFIYRKSIAPVFKNHAFNQAIVYGSGILSIALSIYCLRHLPIVDFRPYKIGNDIVEKMNDGVPDIVETVFIYKHKNTGEEKKVTGKELAAFYKEPGFDQWENVDRIDETLKQGKLSSIHDFVMENEEGEDVTEEVITNPDYNFMIVAYDLNKSDKEGLKEIAALAAQLREKDIDFYGLTSSPGDIINNVKQETGIDFPFYTMDQTALKTIIRANPGILLIKNSVIINKWHNNDLPDPEDLNEKYFN